MSGRSKDRTSTSFGQDALNQTKQSKKLILKHDKDPKYFAVSRTSVPALIIRKTTLPKLPSKHLNASSRGGARYHEPNDELEEYGGLPSNDAYYQMTKMNKNIQKQAQETKEFHNKYNNLIAQSHLPRSQSIG